MGKRKCRSRGGVDDILNAEVRTIGKHKVDTCRNTLNRDTRRESRIVTVGGSVAQTYNLAVVVSALRAVEGGGHHEAITRTRGLALAPCSGCKPHAQLSQGTDLVAYVTGIDNRYHAVCGSRCVAAQLENAAHAVGLTLQVSSRSMAAEQ